MGVKFKRLLTRPYYFIFSLLYIFYFISILWSENRVAAWFDMEVKLSLFWMPIIFGSMGEDVIRLFNKKRIFILFAASCAAAGLFCIIHSYITYIETGNPEEMYYGFFSYFMHTTYFSSYLCFGIVAALYYLIKEWRISASLEKLFYIGIVVVSILSIYFINSRTGYLLFLLALMLLGFMMLRAAILPRILMLPAIAALLIFMAALWLNPDINKRIVSLGEEFKHIREMPEEITEFGAIRMPIWNIAMQKISAKPIFGYGNGDVTDLLVEEYKRYGYDNIVKKRFNTHNQFLQTTLAAGIFALILLCMTLFWPFFRAIKNGDILYSCLMLIFIISFFIDTGLKVQAGVIFYAFFNALNLRYAETALSK